MDELDARLKTRTMVANGGGGKVHHCPHHAAVIVGSRSENQLAS